MLCRKLNNYTQFWRDEKDFLAIASVGEKILGASWHWNLFVHLISPYNDKSRWIAVCIEQVYILCSYSGNYGIPVGFRLGIRVLNRIWKNEAILVSIFSLLYVWEKQCLSVRSIIPEITNRRRNRWSPTVGGHHPIKSEQKAGYVHLCLKGSGMSRIVCPTPETVYSTWKVEMRGFILAFRW